MKFLDLKMMKICLTRSSKRSEEDLTSSPSKVLSNQPSIRRAESLIRERTWEMII
jgi:hypothetical protein